MRQTSTDENKSLKSCISDLETIGSKSLLEKTDTTILQAQLQN